MLLSPFILNFFCYTAWTLFLFCTIFTNICSYYCVTISPLLHRLDTFFQYYVFKSFTTISSVAFMHTITPVTFINSRSLHCLISISCIAVIPFCISFILSLHSCILSINSCSIHSFNPTLTVPSNFS